NITIDYIDQMYKKAGIVHADLSEYNILYYKRQQFLIDVSQAVNKNHPKGLYFLSRDIKNILSFYEKIGLRTPNPIKIYEDITRRA
ncbi:MAG: serine protein kinase RIO, partial [Candidatus Lokiarchaeota archaeon]|nr:serine protein kinase RIO [Candidatus Lokiarchaeota archaeon]